jgi:hypothetical protein
MLLEAKAGEGVGGGDEGGGGAAKGEDAVAGEVVVGGDEGSAEEAVVVDGLEAVGSGDGSGGWDAPFEVAVRAYAFSVLRLFRNVIRRVCAISYSSLPPTPGNVAVPKTARSPRMRSP